LYNDKLTPDAQARITQTISTVYAAYELPSFEFLNEFINVRDTTPATGRTFNNAGFYSQISRRFGSMARPYFRYEYFNVGQSDPFLTELSRRNGPNVGVRLDVSRYAKYEDRISACEPARPENRERRGSGTRLHILGGLRCQLRESL